MSTECLWCGNYPVGFGVGSNEELTGAGIGKFVPLELSSNVECVFVS